MKINIDAPHDGINYDFDYNAEYGDGDIPDIDKPSSNDTLSDDVPRPNGPGDES